ncbi:HeH/LEM domain-containing protein [Pseudomonas aeruginosa]
MKKLTMAELKALLTAKGIPFDKGANKETLLALVPNDD